MKGSSQEGHRSAYKHTAATSDQHGTTSDGKRGDSHRDTNRDRDRDKDKEFSAETAQTVLPFCVLDIRWLLQLNEQYGTDESKVRDTTGEEDYRGTGSRLEKKTGLGYGKSMNEDDARSISTTSRKEEVLDSIQFLQNSVVIITKTHTVLRTVRHARPSTADVSSHHDSPHSPHFNANTSSSRGEVGVHRQAGKEAGKEVVREVQKEGGKAVGKSRQIVEEAVSGLSGQIERDGSTEEGVTRSVSRLDVREVREEVKLVGGTVYTCALFGEIECYLYFILSSCPPHAILSCTVLSYPILFGSYYFSYCQITTKVPPLSYLDNNASILIMHSGCYITCFYSLLIASEPYTLPSPTLTVSSPHLSLPYSSPFPSPPAFHFPSSPLPLIPSYPLVPSILSLTFSPLSFLTLFSDRRRAESVSMCAAPSLRLLCHIHLYHRPMPSKRQQRPHTACDTYLSAVISMSIHLHILDCLLYQRLLPSSRAF